MRGTRASLDDLEIRGPLGHIYIAMIKAKKRERENNPNKPSSHLRAHIYAKEHRIDILKKVGPLAAAVELIGADDSDRHVAITYLICTFLDA